jgi:MATE family multidrug resistance protein
MWLEALSKPSPAMLMMWLANAVNLGIDLVLVPGRFGAPALGAVGGGCATFGSRLFLMVALLVYIARMREARGLGVFDKPAREPAAEAEQRRVGFGAGASNFCETTAFAAMNIVAGWQGAAPLAAWSVVLNFTALIFMVPLGVSTATSVLVGSAYGARDAGRVNRAALVGFSVAAGFAIAIGLIAWPLCGVIAAAYTTSPAVVALARVALMLGCLYFAPDALQVVAAQSLRARGDVWVPTATHMFSYVVVMTPLAWLLALPLHMGLNGQVLAVIIASLLAAGLLLGRFAMLARRGV